MKPIEYFIEGKDDLRRMRGEKGECYSYTWAGNGVFIESENSHLAARVPVAVGLTRGLPELKAEITLKHGKLSHRYLDYIFEQMQLTPRLESYFAIVWEDGSYRVKKPNQEVTDVRVAYELLDNTVMEFHSHVPIY
jgi:hypothetical protein